MTIKEAVDNLAILFDKSTDFPFKEKLRRDVLVGRAEYIRRELNKPGAYPRSLVTHLHNIPLEDHSQDTESKMVVSKYKIPKPIPTKEQEAGFIFVGSTEGTSFTFCRLENAKFRDTKFKPAQTTLYDYRNDHIVVLDDDCDSFDVAGIFSDDKELLNIKDKDGNPVFTEFYIDEDMFTAIRLFVIEANRAIYPNKEVDLENEQRQ